MQLTTFTFEWSIPDPGACFHVSNNESPQDEGRVLGPLSPTCLAIAPVALEARAVGLCPRLLSQQWNMGFPLCSQSGTNSWAHQEDVRDMDSSQEMDHPISSPRRRPSSTETRERSGWPLGPTFPSSKTRRKAPGYRNSAGGWITSRSAFRTEEDKIANTGRRSHKTWSPRIRMKPRPWLVGVSVHYLHLS